MKEKIKEVRCKSCNALLARGVLMSGVNHSILKNLKVRDENARVAKVDFEYRKRIPGEYDDDIVVVEASFSMDVVCRQCGLAHPSVVSLSGHDSFY